MSQVLIPDAEWGRNLDAFNDILRGGFGTPDSGFNLLWRNSDLSRERFGFTETVRQLRNRLLTCHPSNAAAVEKDLERARSGEGKTIFNSLVAIIREHRPGGIEEGDNVHLILD